MSTIGSLIQNSYGVQSTYTKNTTKTSVDYFEITGNQYGNAYGDQIDVSAASREMLDRAKSLDVFSCIFPDNDVRKNAKSLSDVKSDFLSDFNDFSSAFGSMSSLLGLSAGDTYSMGLNGTGGMNITGTDEAGAAALSSAFNNTSGTTSTMTARFAVMAARAALVDAGATEPGFQQAYNEDPYSAITDNVDALKERLLGFKVVASGGELSYGFTRKGELEISEETWTYETAGQSAEAV